MFHRKDFHTLFQELGLREYCRFTLKKFEAKFVTFCENNLRVSNIKQITKAIVGILQEA
jgi:hypothetical protein